MFAAIRRVSLGRRIDVVGSSTALAVGGARHVAWNDRSGENGREYGVPPRGRRRGWRRGSVVASWLLDLTAIALFGQPDLSKFSGRVSDSGEGRWTMTAAIDEGAPAPVLSAAL